jgi:cobalt-zinc-cadmium efflux system membrane fusion protein
MFSTLAEPEKVYSAKIFSLGHTINSNDHTVTVHAKLEKYDKNLIPGLFINAQIEINSDSLYAIPREGLIMGEKNSYVFISISGSYSQVPVKIGLSDENYFSIINPGQNILNHPVVLKGAYFINAAIEGSEEE